MPEADSNQVEKSPEEIQFEKYGHNIAQPTLRELAENERIIRTMGLKFIVTNQFKVGDVLDEATAAFINGAWHTAALNRFAENRKLILENIKAGKTVTYDDIDGELADFMEEFTYSPRQLQPAEEGETPADAKLKAVIAFGRPYFNKAMKGLIADRKEYETRLKLWVTENRTMLEGMMADEKASVEKLLAAMTSEE